MNKRNELKVLAVDSIIQVILQIALLSFTSHFVGPESYGPFSLALLIINFFKNFGLSGISLIILRSKDNKHIGAVTSVVISISILLSLPFIFFNVFISDMLGSANSELPIFYLGSFLVIVSLALILESYLIKVGLIIEYVFTNLITFIANILSFYFFIDSPIPSYMWLTYSFLIAAFVRLIILTFFCRSNLYVFNPFSTTSKSKIKSVLYEFTGVSTISIINSLALNVDTLIVSKYLGETSLGLYTRAFQINNYVSSLYTKLISKLGVKSYSQCEKRSDIENNFKNIYFYTALVAVIVSISLSLNSQIIVTVLFGDSWSGLVSPMEIISLSIAFRLLYKSIDTYLLSFNKIKCAFYLQLFMLFNVVSLVFYAKNFGLIEVCYAILLATFLQFFASMLIAIYLEVTSYLFFLKVFLISVALFSLYYFSYVGLRDVLILNKFLYSDAVSGVFSFTFSIWSAYVICNKSFKKNIKKRKNKEVS